MEEIIDTTPKLVINVRDESGNFMDEIEIAVYKKKNRQVILKEITTETGQVSIPIKIKRPLEVEIRCRKHIIKGVRYNPFSEMHTVYPGGFELNVIMNKDHFFNSQH